MPIFCNREKRIFYIHIPKCAGTTVEHVLNEISDFTACYSDSPKGLPCNAQHFHAELLGGMFDFENLPSFCVVRHPFMRIVSEHRYSNRLRVRRGLKPMEFNAHVRHFFHEFQYDPYIYDNHIRPQVQFLMPGTTVFHLENGIEPVLSHAVEALDPGYVLSGEQLNRVDKKSQRDDFTVTKDTVNRIEDFYSSDYECFAYPLIGASDHKISVLELQEEIKQHCRLLPESNPSAEVDPVGNSRYPTQRLLDTVSHQICRAAKASIKMIGRSLPR